MRTRLQAHAAALAENPLGLGVVALGGALAIGLLAVLGPDVMIGVAMTPIVVTWLTYLLYRKVAAHPDAEFLVTYFRQGIALRVACVGAQLAVGFLIYRGQMDYVSYVNTLIASAERLVKNWEFDLLLDPVYVATNFTSYSVLALFALLGFMMLLVGPNIVAVFLIGAPMSAAATYAFYRAYESLAPDAASRRRFAMLMFLFPSLAFWSVFLGKDVWIFLFLGCTTLALARALDSPSPGRLALLALCAYMVFLIRAHVGGPMIIAIVAALCLRRFPLRGPALYLRPVIQLLVIGGMAYAFSMLVNRALAKVGIGSLSLDDIAERLYQVHTGFVFTQGGSALPQIIQDGTPLEVAKFIPIGLGTFLFRPFVWEAHNAVAFVSGVENLIFLVFVIVRWRSIWYAIRLAPERPLLVFASMFFVLTSILLSFEWNLGATQRHRTMVLPFFFMILALPTKRAATAPPA